MSNFYEVDFTPMGEAVSRFGPSEVDYLTADEDDWENGQTHWNIFVTKRDSEHDILEEVLDIAVPFKYAELAEKLLEVCDEWAADASKEIDNV